MRGRILEAVLRGEFRLDRHRDGLGLAVAMAAYAVGPISGRI